MRHPMAKNFSSRGAVVLVVALLSLSIGAGATGEALPGKNGPEIGQPAPSFTLKDQNGKDVSLDALTKQGPVALVFYRSSEWCLACQLQLIKLQRRLKDIEATGGRLVCISYDSITTTKKFADRKKITLPLLADPGSRTIDAYGVRDPDAASGKEGSAQHAIVVVDQRGLVRVRLYQVIYDEQPGVDALVKAFKEAQNIKEGTKP